MTDHEFALLKIKINVAEAYAAELQRQYQGQTGARFFPFGNLTDKEKDMAVEMILNDFTAIESGVHYA